MCEEVSDTATAPSVGEANPAVDSFDSFCCFQSLPSFSNTTSPSNPFESEHFCGEVITQDDDPFCTSVIYSELTDLPPGGDVLHESVMGVTTDYIAVEGGNTSQVIYETCTSTVPDDAPEIPSMANKDKKNNNVTSSKRKSKYIYI